MINGSGSTLWHGFLRAALLLALLAWPSPPRAQAILAHEVVEPRTFGYAIGDKIRRQVRLSVRSGFHLDEDSLPEAGRLDRWLELAAPEIRVESISNGRRYDLTLTYQIFSAPLAPEVVTIPQENLRIVGETQALTTLIPALRVTVAPITARSDTAALRGSSLQQDRSPATIPVRARIQRLAMLLAALLALLLYAAWRRGLMAFVARGNLPFTSAVRRLKRLQRMPDAPARFAAGLKIAHQAINRTAGRAVFAHNLDDFLAAHPSFAGLRGEFEQLFATSDGVFYGNAAAAPAHDWPALLRLCRHCSSIERRAPGLRRQEKPEKAPAS